VEEKNITISEFKRPRPMVKLLVAISIIIMNKIEKSAENPER